jgi:hypothetical protein
MHIDEDDEEYEGGGSSDFHAAVAQIAGRRPTLEKRQAAIRLAARQHPGLYRAFLIETNGGGKSAARRITEKLDADAARLR